MATDTKMLIITITNTVENVMPLLKGVNYTNICLNETFELPVIKNKVIQCAPHVLYYFVIDRNKYYSF